MHMPPTRLLYTSPGRGHPALPTGCFLWQPGPGRLSRCLCPTWPRGLPPSRRMQIPYQPKTSRYGKSETTLAPREQITQRREKNPPNYKCFLIYYHMNQYIYPPTEETSYHHQITRCLWSSLSWRRNGKYLEITKSLFPLYLHSLQVMFCSGTLLGERCWNIQPSHKAALSSLIPTDHMWPLNTCQVSVHTGMSPKCNRRRHVGKNVKCFLYILDTFTCWNEYSGYIKNTVLKSTSPVPFNPF